MGCRIAGLGCGATVGDAGIVSRGTLRRRCLRLEPLVHSGRGGPLPRSASIRPSALAGNSGDVSIGVGDIDYGSDVAGHLLWSRDRLVDVAVGQGVGGSRSGFGDCRTLGREWLPYHVQSDSIDGRAGDHVHLVGHRGWMARRLFRANWCGGLGRPVDGSRLVHQIQWLVPSGRDGSRVGRGQFVSRETVGVAWLRWRCWGVMLITAVVVWIPAWLDLQEHGGYAAVAANHSGYIEGWSYWMENFRRQFENLRWWDLLGRHIGFFSMAVIPLVLSLFGLGLRLVQLVRSAWNHEALTEDILSGWMVLAWVSSLLLVTPLYHPYPRLALPLFLALLVGSGYGLQILSLLWKETQHSDNPALESSSEGSVSRETNVVKIAVWALVSGLISVMMIGFPIAPGHGGTPWDQRRTSAERVAEGIVEECGRLSVRSHSAPIDYVIYVYSEPAIYYHLCRVAPENVLVSPVANLGFLAHPPAREPVPIYLVTGPHAERSDSFRDQLEETKGRLEALFIDQIPVSDLVSLNSYSPEMVLDPPYHFPAAEYQLWLMIDSINSPSE